jgi:hypothetical protein
MPEVQMAFTRIVTHYFNNGAWLEEAQFLRHAEARRHSRRDHPRMLRHERALVTARA